MVKPAEFIVLSVQSVIICLCLTHHFWNSIFGPMCCRCAQLGLRQSCLEAWCSFTNYVWQILRNDVGVIDATIAKQMDDCRLAQFRDFCKGVAPFYGVMWLFVIVVPNIGGEADADCSGQLAVAPTIYLGCAYICTHLVASGCLHMNYWVLSFCYMVSVCAAIVRVLVAETQLDGLRLLLQLVPGILYMDYSKTIPCNCLVMIAVLGRNLHDSLSIEADCLGYAFQKVIYREVVLCFGASVYFYVAQGQLQARIRLHIISQNQQNATQKMASYNCDALCWLAPNLRFSKPAPQLASMLFLEGNNSDLEGREFVNCLANESDQERFKESVNSSVVASLSAELPMLLHIDLRDSAGRAFPVHIFHSCFLDDKDRIGHLLGISETAAHTPVMQETREMMPDEVAPPPLAAIAADIEPAGLERRSADGAGSEQPPASNGASSLTGDETLAFVPIIPERRALAPVSVVFDSMTYEIVGCTTGLTALIGPLAFRTNILNIIVNFPTFCQWLDHTVNLQLHNTSDPEHAPFDIKVAPPRGAQGSSFEFHGSADVIQVGQTVLASAMGVEPLAGIAEEEEEYDLLCVLEIKDAEVHWVSQPRKKKKKRRVARTVGTMTL